MSSLSSRTKFWYSESTAFFIYFSTSGQHCQFNFHYFQFHFFNVYHQRFVLFPASISNLLVRWIYHHWRCGCFCLSSWSKCLLASGMLHLLHLSWVAGRSHLFSSRWASLLWTPSRRNLETTLLRLRWGKYLIADQIKKCQAYNYTSLFIMLLR